MRLLSAGYGHDVETTTDVTAMLYLSRAGIDPGGMIQVMEKLNPPNASKEIFWEISSDAHPRIIDRIAELQRPGGVFLLMTMNPFVWSRRSTLRATGRS